MINFVAKTTIVLFLSGFFSDVYSAESIRHRDPEEKNFSIKQQPPPFKAEEIEKNVKDREAQNDLPEKNTIKIARFNRKDVEIKCDSDSDYCYAEAKFDTLKRGEWGKNDVTMLGTKELKNIQELKKQGLDFPGKLPGHLSLNANPKDFVKAVRKQIGENIPNSVFDPDSRYVYRDTSYPWSTVGRVDPSGCTGTMIGKRLMLTASHCVNWIEGGGAQAIKFTPAYFNGEDPPFGSAWSTNVISWLKVDGSDGMSQTEVAFDYVVFVLDEDIGDLTGYTGFREYSSSWNGGTYWQQMGYPSGLTGNEKPAFSNRGTITSRETRSNSGQTGYILGNRIDTEPGHSGGPYWGWWEGEDFPRIVADDSTSPGTPTLSGTSGDNQAAGGPALYDLMIWARQNY